MGMFDTVHLREPLACATCGAKIDSVQTKEFDCVLANLRIGSVLSGASIRSGIIKDWAYCMECHKSKRSDNRTDFFMVVWHSILVGIETTESAAEKRLAAVDRLDLIGWLEEAQRGEEEWRGRFHRLHDELSRWHDYLEKQKLPPESDDNKRHRFSFFEPPEEIRQAADPILAIVEKHGLKAGESGMDEW